MKTYRPHRFPPLPARTGNALVPLQASVADGFQQGMAQGYAEGHEAGLADGRASGLSEGHREGLRQGADEGRRQAEQAFETAARPLDAIVAELDRLHADYRLAQRKEVVDLVARVARQVIRCELTLQPTQLLTLVDEALAAMPPTREQVEVYLNPEDLQRIRDLDPDRVQRWSLLADARLQTGECHVRAGDHEADAGCQQRLAACMQQVSAQLLDTAGAHLQVVPAPMQEAA